MTNIARGDIAIHIDGQGYIIRPTFQALCEIESATGKSILLLAEELSEGQMGVSDMACIIAAGIKAGSHVELGEEIIGAEMLRVGVGQFLTLLSTFLHIALTGEIKKKAR